MDCIQKSTFDRLRVAFNNRRVLGQPWRCSASAMYANFGINNFEATIRKSTFEFIQRLAKSTNSLTVCITATTQTNDSEADRHSDDQI